MWVRKAYFIVLDISIQHNSIPVLNVYAASKEMTIKYVTQTLRVLQGEFPNSLL